jgi:putative transcriptional regulator
MLMLEKQMLRWKLREVMARGKITNRELAIAMQVHETSISRLKTADTMPRIDGETLNNICFCLTKLFREKGIDLVVTPMDLFDYIPDEMESE